MSYLLNVQGHEWNDAIRYFDDPNNSNEIKYKKPSKRQGRYLSGTGHSFIKINGTIYAMANQEKIYLPNEKDLGEGAYSRVKLGQTRNGENYAINIRGQITKPEYEAAENHILATLGRLYGMVERILPADIQFWKNSHKNLMTHQKHYKVIQHFEGTRLTEEIKAKRLDDTQKVIIGIKLCQTLNALFETYRIMHRDIKPDNIIVNIAGNNINVELIDMGFAIQLPLGQLTLTGPLCGTPNFMAPEIKKIEGIGYSTQQIYSHQSDIFALGVTLKKLKLPRHITEWMINHAPERRQSLDDTIAFLISHLEATPEAASDQHVREIIKGYYQPFEDELRQQEALRQEEARRQEEERQRLIEQRQQEAIRLEKIEAQRLAEAQRLREAKHSIPTASWWDTAIIPPPQPTPSWWDTAVFKGSQPKPEMPRNRRP